MTDNPGNKKPNEFFFNFRVGDKESVCQETCVWINAKNGKHDFHVIEKSAFDELQKERDELKAQLEATQMQSYYRGQTSLESMKVIEELKAENERLKEHIKDIAQGAVPYVFAEKIQKLETHADQLAKLLKHIAWPGEMGGRPSHKAITDALAAWAKFRSKG